MILNRRSILCLVLLCTFFIKNSYALEARFFSPNDQNGRIGPDIEEGSRNSLSGSVCTKFFVKLSIFSSFSLVLFMFGLSCDYIEHQLDCEIYPGYISIGALSMLITIGMGGFYISTWH